MKIQVLSDIHLEFEAYEWVDCGADVVVLAGDIGVGVRGIEWALDEINKPVIYVLGNHEYYRHDFDSLCDEARALAAGTHLHLLENSEVTIEGTRFLGCSLWTDFDLYNSSESAQVTAQSFMADYRVISSSKRSDLLQPFQTIDAHRTSLQWLESALAQPSKHEAKPTVVVTHHAPSEKSVPSQYINDPLTPAFATSLEHLIEANHIDLWIHGHMHQPSDYEVANTRVICNPRGYPMESDTAFHGDFLAKI